MAESPIVAATKKWRKITAQVGQNPASDAVQKMDLQRVSTGVTGLSQQEALAAISSASSGHQALQKQPSTSLMGLPGRFAQDIGSMGVGLGIGLAHLVSHPARDIKGAITAVPQTIEQIAHPQQEGLGGELRAIASSPYGKFVPGSQTAAGLTTEAGRKGLLQHPGFTAADLLPYASEGLGAIAKAGLVGDVTKVAGEVGYAARAGSVAESALQGKVTTTALRAMSQGIEKITHGEVRPAAGVAGLSEALGITKAGSTLALRWNGYLDGRYALQANKEAEVAAVTDLVKSHAIWQEMPLEAPVGFPGEPGYQSGLSDAHKALLDAVEAYPTKPHAIANLPADQADLVKRSWGTMHKMQFASWMYNKFLAGSPQTWDDLRAEITHLHPHAVNQYLDHYKEANPWEYELSSYGKQGKLPASLEAVLPHGVPVGRIMPKALHDVLYKSDGLWHGLERVPRQPGIFGKAMKGTTGLYKRALFLRPMMALRIGIGSLVQMIGEHDALTPQNFASTVEHLHNGDLAHMARGFKGMDGDQAHRFLQGASLGRLYKEAGGGVKGAAEATRGLQSKLVDLTTHMQHALVYTSAYDKAVGTEGEVAARMAGEDAVAKVFTSWMSMTPGERAIVSYVFPFYGFQKHIIQYLGRYPAEHPFATSVYAKIAQSETDMHSSGLPQQLQQMFHIGGTDANGKFLGVNMAGFNPFSRVAGDVSLLSGFATSVNPALSAALEAFGVTHQGTPELYPNLTVDPVTGNLTTTRPKTTPFTLAEHFIPELSTIDEILGFNNKLKTMRAQNPSAYRAYLLQQIGIPAPQTVDTPQQIARMSDNLYRVAQQDISGYLRTGDPGYISGYQILPYQGRWMTPKQLEDLYNTARRTPHAPSTAVKNLIPKLRKVPATPPPTGL